MQASECGYNTQYPRTPGGITDPEYSIAVGIHNLADCLQTAGAESPIDLDHIQLALQGYDFGSGYITWVLQKYGEYSRVNAIELSLKMAEQMGWNSYGDKQYVPHVLRYYPIGKVFYTPEDGDAIVVVALTQVGNVGANPIGAGTALPTMWNGAPASSAGVPTNAATWTAEPTPNSPAASSECNGSSSVASGWTAPPGPPRTVCRIMWALWKRWTMGWSIP